MDWRRVAEQPPIALADASTDAGAMERLFMLEATSPGYIHRYSPGDNLTAMRLMRQTIENRLRSPRLYGAGGATTATDIVDMGNQFEGFGDYPVLNARLTANLQDILRAATNPRHPQQSAYAQFVRDAITAATESVTPPTTNYPTVTAWRTYGSGSPGANFRELVTLSGNTFYSTVPVPPHARRRHRH